MNRSERKPAARACSASVRTTSSDSRRPRDDEIDAHGIDRDVGENEFMTADLDLGDRFDCYAIHLERDLIEFA